MTLRSMLFVPGDSERKLAKAASSGADALILDLEDSVAPTRTAAARGLVLEYLQSHANRSQQLWVRINPLDTPVALLDLMVVAGRPCGVMVPKVNSGADVVQLTLQSSPSKPLASTCVGAGASCRSRSNARGRRSTTGGR